MVLAIVVGVMFLLGVVAFVGLGRDLRKLHRSGRHITDRPSDIAGVSAAGVTVIGNNITH